MEGSAVREVGVGDAQEAGLVAAGGAVAEGEGEGEVARGDLEEAADLGAGAGEVEGAEVVGFGHGWYLT